MEFRDFSDNGNETWDCEVNHPEFGWIPYTVSRYDDAEVNVYLVEQFESDGLIDAVPT